MRIDWGRVWEWVAWRGRNGWVGCWVAEDDRFAGLVTAGKRAAVLLAGFSASAVGKDGGEDVCGAHFGGLLFKRKRSS